MKVKLAYGKTGLEVNLPDDRVTVVEPECIPGLVDEKSAFIEALRHPIGTLPLRDLVKSSDTVAIVFSDITRPTPNKKILPWLLEEISHVPRNQVVLINGIGLHRPNTREELTDLIGREVMDHYRVINHEPHKKELLTYLGKTRFGGDIWINSEYLEASVKILTGFIEPHFFAGFSGGPKAVLPSVSGHDSIMHNHSARMIGHPNATWGITSGNPIFEEMLEVALLTRPTFLANVTINSKKEITGVFAGDLVQAHSRGTEFVKKTAMRPVPEPFDIVITTNSGYPLDLNLYQAVKGMSAASRIVKEGGSILIASECSQGVPDHGNYGKLLQMRSTPAELLEMINAPDFSLFDQWQVQIQAMIQLKARVYVYSLLPDDVIRKCQLLPCQNIEATVDRLLQEYGPQARIAVLPQGPMTIPYLAK
jgi:nickel-dependent lactate racemase